VRSPGLRLLIHLRRSSGPVATLSFLLRAILIGLGRCLASIAFSLAPSLIWNPWRAVTSQSTDLWSAHAYRIVPLSSL
jgi:hypothetical protein